MARNIIRADFTSAGGNRYTSTKRKDQYDYGQKLEIIGLDLPDVFEVDFCNEEDPDTVTMIGQDNIVDVPDQFFETGRGILAYIYLHEGLDDGETEYRIFIPVGTRAERTDAEPTPVQQDVITQTIAALNDGVERAEAAAEEIKNMTAVAETLEPGSSATASWEDGTLTIGVPKGLKGDQGDQGLPGIDGVGIEDIVINADHTLTVVLTDGSTYTTEPVIGEKGDKGDKGDRGERGLRGVGILQTFMNANYTLTLVYDDGSTYTTFPLRGEKGDKGDKGDPGENANLLNLVDGSASGSIRGVNTVTESSSYTIGENATTLGAGTRASGQASTAEGAGTLASGQYSHAEGVGATASSVASHAEGQSTASGQYAHSEGNGTTASGNYSHAENGGNTASGQSSHAEGSETTASGVTSHSEGHKTIANHKSQHVFGEFNTADASSASATERGNYVEIVGKGTAENARSNARTLDWDGNEVLAGKLTMGANPTANMDAATKGYVDTQIATAVSDIDGGLFTDWN